MRLPDDLRSVLEALRSVGRPRIVGGSVRDWLLGIEPKDFDVEVAGVDFETLHRVLAPFGNTDIVGRSFGVLKLRLGGAEYDFSLPRRESKVGSGHRGFTVLPEPDLTDAEAAARRDFTVNSIAYDPIAGTVIDPHGGERDLRARILRHTSAAFSEDPLRVLRGFQLASRFDFSLAPETAALCRRIKGAYQELPVERVWTEWLKWSEKAEKPSRGLKVLEETEWLEHFPEIAALRGTQQDPSWHPEGDVFTHTAHCCDALSAAKRWREAPAERRRVLMFAILAHDFGKPSTTQWADRRGEMRWVSPGHEGAGVPLAENFLVRIGALRDVIERVKPLVAHHLIHHHNQGEITPNNVRRLARKLAPSNIDDLCIVMRADHDGRPPLHSAATIERIEALRRQAETLELQNQAPRPLLLGRHLLEAGLAAGPHFKPLLDKGFEAQLDGAFADEEGAKTWLRNSLRDRDRSLGL